MEPEISLEGSETPEYMDNTNNSILRDIHLGDLVELLVDGNYFFRMDGQHERYAGYVTITAHNLIGLSPTHTENKRHGTDDGRLSNYNYYEQKTVGVSPQHVIKYRIL